MPVLSYRLCSVVVAYPSVAAWSDPSFLHVANYKAFCCLPMLKVQMKQVQNNKQFVSNKSCRRGVDIWFWVNLPAPCFLTYDDIYMVFFVFNNFFFYFLPFIFFFDEADVIGGKPSALRYMCSRYRKLFSTSCHSSPYTDIITFGHPPSWTRK